MYPIYLYWVEQRCGLVGVVGWEGYPPVSLSVFAGQKVKFAPDYEPLAQPLPKPEEVALPSVPIPIPEPPATKPAFGRSVDELLQS